MLQIFDVHPMGSQSMKKSQKKHKSNILDTTPLASFHEKPAFLYFLILVFGDPMNFATDLEVADLMARCPVAVLVTPI